MSDQPEDGAWVYASTKTCPERLAWQRRGNVWFDAHGCTRQWDELVEPIETLRPRGPHPMWEMR